jgi:hypothetical protein
MKTTGYEYHPYADLFPLMGGDELAALAADIAANGLREEIVRHEGKVLDGRNRLKACELAGADPRFADYEGDDPLGFVVSKNLHRRHLDTGQRAMVAARLANLERGKPANSPVYETPVSQAKAAEMLNVGERAVRDAKKVQTDGVPELAAAVEKGEVSVSAAAAVAKLPKADQRKAVKAGPAAVRDAGKKPAAPPVSAELVGKVAAALRKNPKATDHALAGVCGCTAPEAKAAKKAAKKLKADDGEPEPQPAKVTPPAAVDAWGIPVQPHAAEAFAGAPQFDTLLAKLRECHRDVGALVDDPAGKHLLKHVQWEKSGNKAGGRWVLAYLENAIATVERCKPAVTDCPYAHDPDRDHPENCRLCHNLRWLGNAKGHQIPPVLTAAMKARYGVGGAA